MVLDYYMYCNFYKFAQILNYNFDHTPIFNGYLGVQQFYFGVEFLSILLNNAYLVIIFCVTFDRCATLTTLCRLARTCTKDASLNIYLE